MITMQWNMATNNAALEVWGQDWIHKMSKAPPHEVMRFNKLKHKMMAEIVAENDPLMRNHLIVMTNQTDELAWRCGKFVHGMLEGLLKAECIQAWTTYEVLLEDLHGAAIDENPKCFSQDTLDKRARQIANSKGSKFHFRKRDNFRDAYDFAFSSDEHINAADCHEDINALAAVRHLLVHKSGYVDQSFIDELPTAPLLKRFGAIEKGKLLLFDGLVVCQIIDATVNQGYNLLRAVDAWLSRQLATIPNVP
jgi:hypothetical protein